MKPLFVRELSGPERHALQVGLRSSAGFTLRRCHILFASARGDTTTVIAQAVGCSPQAVRFVEGRPVSRVTTAFLAWVAQRLAKDGKRVWVLVWDNAAWHVSRAVQAWIGAHNRTVKRTGGVRILVCRLPVKSPWLNPIEPRWLHGKRAIVEPERTLTAHELMDRVHQHFGCERLEPLHQHVR